MAKNRRKHATKVRSAAAHKSLQPAALLHSFIGMPVCTVLKDGSFYYGIVREADGEEVVLQGFQGERILDKDPAKAKAQIASLGGLGGMLGGLGSVASGLGGLGGLFGGGAAKGAATGGGFSWSSIGKWMRIGMGMISFVMPLLKNFSI